MDTENFIEHIGKDLGMNGSVDSVYGEPIEKGEKIILPVACIRYGFGGGYGQAKKDKRYFPELFAEGKAPEGAGGGGGIYAKPKGIYEITENSTRFIPANSSRQIITGIVIGFLLKTFFFSGRKKK